MSTVFYVSYVALWLLLLVQSVLLVLVYRHFGLVALGTAEGVQRDGLAIGTSAPPIGGMTAKGERVDWQPAPGRKYLLAFVSPDCGPCTNVLPALAQLSDLVGNVDVPMIVPGPRDVVARLIERYEPSTPDMCLSDDSTVISNLYRVRVTPFAFMIGDDGRILAKGLCDNVAKLKALLTAGGVDMPEVLMPVASPIAG